MRLRLLAILLTITALSACSLPAETPTRSTEPTDHTVLPGATRPATAAAILTKSIGTPVPGWENIPIMPGAYKGELDDMTYLYSVKETVEDVEQYYLAKMDVNGWTLANRKVLETASSGPSTILDFQKSDQWLNVMLVHVPAENGTTVLLMQLAP
ncbi:MAG: hypothetical protein ACM3XO_19640 [Bacteroidota bacterium]